MKKTLSFFLVILITSISICISHAEAPNVDAPSYILMDLKTGQILYENNADERMYPASTTKIMTAVIALERGKLDQVMAANQKNIDPGPGGMNIGIMAGEELTMWDLLNALLIKSANETANILAENICPTREEFVDLMNGKAKELGAANTHFVTVNGMHDNNHYTTARDMAKISLYAMKNNEFRKIVEKSKHDMTPTNKHSKWDTLYTTNKLLYYKSELFSKVLGIKTGYTSQAGHCLVSAAGNEAGMELMAVMFGVRDITSRNNVYSQSERLLEYGFKNFSLQEIEKADTKIKDVEVVEAKDNAKLDLVTGNSFSTVLPNDPGQHNIEKTEKYLYTIINAPVKKGDKLGYIEYRRNGTELGKVDIVAANDIEKAPKVIDKVKNVAGNSFVKYLVITVVVLVLVFLALRITLRKVSRMVRARKQ